MTGFARLRNAARRRARLMRETDEGGYILLYVLLVSMMITGMIAAVTTSAMNAAVPAQQSTYSLSATAAAEGAIQDYYATLVGASSCTSLVTLAAGSGACTGLGPGSTSGRITMPSADSQYGFTTANQVHYTWKVVSAVNNATNSFVRVQGTGEVGQPGTGLYTTKTLTADISGGATQNFLDYGYYSTYETLSSNEVQKEFTPNRTIAFDARDPLYQAGVTDVSALAATPANPTKVTWGGVPTTGNTGSQWCNAVYYTPGDTSSTLNTATGGQGRYLHTSSLPTGYDWAETVTGSSLNGTTHDGVCQVDFTTGNHMTGPLYSEDAYLLSYGTQGGAGPQFDDPAYSAWSSKDVPAAAAPYNPFPVIGGGTKDNKNAPQTATWTLTLPSDASGSLTDNTATQVCQYTGPTRIYVKGGTAYVTSPMTAAVGGNPCYQSYPDSGQTASIVPSGQLSGGGTLPGAGTPSVLQAHVPVANTLIYVHDAKLASTTAWNNQTIFNVSGSNTIGSVLDTSTTTVTKGSMSNMSGLPHNSTLGGAVINSNGTLKGSTTSSLSSDFLGALQSGFQSSQGSTLYTSVAAAGTPGSSNTDAYYVTLNPTSDPTPTAYNDASNPDSVLDPSGVCPSTTAPAPDSRLTAPVLGDGDPLLGQQAQGTSQKTTACTGKTVNATIYHLSAHCSLWLIVCLGYSGWDTSTAGTASATRVVRNSTTTVVTAPNTSFPLSSDVTRYQTYQNGPGDAYVEGNVTGKLSVVSDHDVIVTGNLTAKDSSSGTALVADDNVRVYHPVSCVDTTASSLAATTPGYCPNDTTGLSPIGKLYFGPANFTEHPSRQYQNLPVTSGGTPLQNVTIDAAVFALNGSFIVDNYDRGDGYGWDSSGNNFGLQSDGLNTLTLDGGVYQLHHGAAGVQWPIMTSDTQRPTSGYVTTIDWDKDMQGLGLPYVPNPSGGNGASTWKILSTSTGTGTQGGGSS